MTAPDRFCPRTRMKEAQWNLATWNYHTGLSDGVPRPIRDRVVREIEAGADAATVLLLADQVRAAGEHLRHLGAEDLAAKFRAFAAAIVDAAPPPEETPDAN